MRREERVNGVEFSVGATKVKRLSTIKLMSIMFHEHIPDNDRIESATRSTNIGNIESRTYLGVCAHSQYLVS